MSKLFGIGEQIPTNLGEGGERGTDGKEGTERRTCQEQ